MKRKIIPYREDLKDVAKQLRSNMTLAEVLLWKKLRNKQMLGYDFDRQRPIGNYIVDFYCKELNLAIEVDGSSHDSEEAYLEDVKRQKQLEEQGVRFLRFKDRDVKKSMNEVLRIIQYWIEDNTKPMA